MLDPNLGAAAVYAVIACIYLRREHGKACRIADALNRRRRNHEDPRLRNHRQPLVQPVEQLLGDGIVMALPVPAAAAIPPANVEAEGDLRNSRPW